MMNSLRKIKHLTEDAYILYKVLLAVSGIALGVLAWNSVSYVRSLLLFDYNFKTDPWTYIFFHPLDSNLLNYIALCIVLGLFGLVFYSFINQRNSELIKSRIAEKRAAIVSQLVLSVIALATMAILPVALRIAISVVIFTLPYTYFIKIENNKTHIVLTAMLAFLVLFEPLSIVFGPARLMNEYDDLFSDSLINGQAVNNSRFLAAVTERDISSINLLAQLYKRYELKKRSENTTEIDERYIDRTQELFNEFKFKNIEPLQHHIASLQLGGDETIDRQSFENLNRLDIDQIKKFYFNNRMEYSHQNMSRGQINHIGHILNPLNEYELGKPVKDIYLQYGLGNTFLVKWTMDLFGGLSFENYYKCFVYYIIYFLSFLLLLRLLFRDAWYVFSAFALLAIAFYYQKYIALIIAPGILPTVHLLDTTALILALFYFKSRRSFYFGLAAFFSLAAIMLNRQFGLILAVALMGSVLLYILENKEGKGKKVGLFVISLMLASTIILLRYVDAGTFGVTFSYYLLGLFSWPANSFIVTLTICYLVISYAYLFAIKDSRYYMKYFYVMLFIYTQGLFTYFYWSGLTNHLPTVIPFVGLQIVLMIYINEKTTFAENMMVHNAAPVLKKAVSFLLVAVVLFSAKGYYKEKSDFKNNFENHKTYIWDFDRAHIISTINPEPIKDSIALIQQYSKSDKGIYILSKYDNLLPYLAQRYSRMPFFELPWHLFSKEEVADAINAIKIGGPQYLFTDNAIEQAAFIDPWAVLYNSDVDKKERSSRFGRYSQIQKIFNAIKQDYFPYQKGMLLTVYKRRS